MKNFIILFVLFLAVMMIAISCEKDNSAETKSSFFPKEELIEIFSTYPDEEINNLSVDIDKLLELEFTPLEREELILTRAKNFLSDDSKQMMETFFMAFHQEYGKSYLGSSLSEREEFAGRYLKKLSISRLPTEKSLTCDWPWLDCTDLQDCPSQGDFVFYQQNRFAREDIVAHDCNRQEGTTDCDNSYDWIPTTQEYNNPENYDFIWYCANAIYRAYMPSGISGFKRSNVQRYSTFLGNQHEIAVNLTWWLEECPNDSWVNVTEFDAFPKPISTCAADCPDE